MSSVVSFYLREQTWPLHERLDKMPLLARLGNGDASADQLRAVLLTWLPLWVQWEDRVGSNLEIPEIFPSLGSWRRGVLLKRDLVALGMTHEEVESVAATALSGPSNTCDSGSAAGLLYVLEGSRLGGLALAKRLGPKISPSLAGMYSGAVARVSTSPLILEGLSEPEPASLIHGVAAAHQGLSFFYGLGSSTAAHWRIFKESLDDWPWDSGDLQAMVCSARECFEALISSVQQLEMGLNPGQSG